MTVTHRIKPSRRHTDLMIRSVVIASAVLIAVALLGCGTGDARRASSDRVARVSAVQLYLADIRTRANAKPTDGPILRQRMRRYVARRALPGYLASTLATARHVRPTDPPNPHLDSFTVGEWNSTDASYPNGSVTFTGYETISGRFPGRIARTLSRITVKMRWEDGRWKFVSQNGSWLTGAGPLDTPGNITIRDLPEHIVFR